MFHRSRGTNSSTSRKASFGCSCRYQAAKSASRNAASSFASAKPASSASRVRNRAIAWSFSARATVPATIPTRWPRRSSSERTPGRSRRDDQPEPGAGIGDAPGHAARRARVDRLAGDDVAAPLGQAMPGAIGAGAPVELDRPAQDPADPLGHGRVQAPRLAVGRLIGPRHRGRHAADDQCLRADGLSSAASAGEEKPRTDTRHGRRSAAGIALSGRHGRGTEPRPARLAGGSLSFSSGRAKTKRVLPRRALRSQGAPSPAKPAVQPPQPTQTAMYCRPSRV